VTNDPSIIAVDHRSTLNNPYLQNSSAQPTASSSLSGPVLSVTISAASNPVRLEPDAPKSAANIRQGPA
jgi:hypothetical protein